MRVIWSRLDVQGEVLEQTRVGPGIAVFPGVKERVVQFLFLLLDLPPSVFLAFFFWEFCMLDGYMDT